MGPPARRTFPTLFAALLFVAAADAQVNWLLQSPPAAPPTRGGFAIAYDGLRERTVLFGGSCCCGLLTGCTYLNDTWEWDGTTWTQRTPAASPPPQVQHQMAWDSARGRVVLVSDSTLDLWEWDGTNWTHRAPATAPPGRAGFAIAYDALRQRIVLFGGSCCCGPFTGCTYFNETWEWDGTSWMQRAPATSPPPQVQHKMVFDGLRGRIVLVSDGTLDLWEWDGTDWSHRAPAGVPPGRGGFGLCFDSVRQRTILFGGGCCCGVFGGCTWFNDTWEFDGTSWTQRAPLQSPSPRTNCLLVHDERRARSLLMNWGGAETWEYAGDACFVAGPGHPGGGLPIGCTGSRRSASRSASPSRACRARRSSAWVPGRAGARRLHSVRRRSAPRASSTRRPRSSRCSSAAIR